MSRSRGGALAEAARAVGATLLVLAALEGGLRLTYLARNALVESVPLPYVIGQRYGPAPPWVDGLRILEDDDFLLWRGRPNVRQRYVDVFAPARSEAERTALLRRFLPRLPEWLRERPTWEVELDAEGFRVMGPPPPAPATLRIVCLGDSWTFGTNVGPRDSYPSRLAEGLRARWPHATIEVRNLGVLGYSSFQGLRLLRSRALDLDPDVVVLGFAMNDSSVAGYRDRDLPGSEPERPLHRRIVRQLGRLELVRLPRYLVALARWEPHDPGRALRRVARARDEDEERFDYESAEPWTRVSVRDYESNLREMIALSRRAGAEVALLYNEFEPESPYREALARISVETRVPFVDTSRLVADERARIQEARRRGLALREAGPAGAAGGGTAVVFRVLADPRRVPDRIYLAGSHPALGDGVPNRIALHDDGTHGDERAGDGVWSTAARFSEPLRVAYVYTNSGRPGRWEGLDVPAVRRFRIPPQAEGRTLYRPIEAFGTLDLHADAWHTDATGYRLLATRLAEALAAREALVRRLGPPGDAEAPLVP